MKKVRYYIDTVGVDDQAVKDSFSKATEICQSDKSVTQITFLIHTQSNTGYFERAFGSDKLKGLFQGSITAYKGGPPVKIETVKTIKGYEGNLILCPFGLKSDELFGFDDFHNVSYVIAVPWLKDSVDIWAKTWEAEEIRTKVKAPPIPLPDKVVQRAFDSLTTSVNLSTGITHPSDEHQCKTYIRALDKYNYKMDENEVFAYLVKEKGWYSSGAKDVVEIISKINNGKTFKGGDKTGLQSYVKNWEK